MLSRKAAAPTDPDRWILQCLCQKRLKRRCSSARRLCVDLVHFRSISGTYLPSILPVSHKVVMKRRLRAFVGHLFNDAVTPNLIKQAPDAHSLGFQWLGANRGTSTLTLAAILSLASVVASLTASLALTTVLAFAGMLVRIRVALDRSRTEYESAGGRQGASETRSLGPRVAVSPASQTRNRGRENN